MTTTLEAQLNPVTGTRGLSFSRIVRSEWVKLRSLPSSYILVASSVAAMVGVGMLGAGGMILAQRDGQPVATQAIQSMPMAGLSFGQLLLAALAVLLISSEFGTGMIRPTLTAAPMRTGVLAAKALVAAGIGAVTGATAAFLSYLLIQPILAQEDLDYALENPRMYGLLLATGVYLALAAVLAVNIGVLLRNSAGAIVTVIGLLFVLPTALSMIPGEVAAEILRYLPSEAGSQLMAAEIADGELTRLEGGLVMTAWAVGFTIASVLVFRRRDV